MKGDLKPGVWSTSCIVMAFGIWYLGWELLATVCGHEFFAGPLYNCKVNTSIAQHICFFALLPSCYYEIDLSNECLLCRHSRCLHIQRCSHSAKSSHFRKFSSPERTPRPGISFRLPSTSSSSSFPSSSPSLSPNNLGYNHCGSQTWKAPHKFLQIPRYGSSNISNAKSVRNTKHKWTGVAARTIRHGEAMDRGPWGRGSWASSFVVRWWLIFDYSNSGSRWTFWKRK